MVVLTSWPMWVRSRHVPAVGPTTGGASGFSSPKQAREASSARDLAKPLPGADLAKLLPGAGRQALTGADPVQASEPSHVASLPSLPL